MKPKRFTKKNCAPMVKNKTINKKSCYTDSIMLKLKKEYNKQNPEDKITFTKPNSIWNAFKKRLKGCENEGCWLKKLNNSNISQKVSEISFSPKHPPSWKKNPNEWLNSVDIVNLMQQYEKQNPNFKFIGPSPIDFDKKKMFGQCVWNDLCHFSLHNYLNKGINKIGIILNTDPHYLSGAHWICIFINLKKKFIYYFDSNADSTPKQVKTFIDKVKKQGINLGINLEEFTNKTEHQRSDTECGMYVLYIIITLIKTNSYPNFTERIPDKDMEKLRKVFFN